MHKLLKGWYRDAAADGGAGSGNGNGAANSGDEKKTLKEWQAALDTQFAERGKQGASTREKEILTALGVDTLEAAQAKLKAAKDAETAQQTELQKAQTAATESKALAEKAETDRKAGLARADEKLLRAAVIASATTVGVDEAELKTLWLLLKDDAGLRAKITPKAGDEDEFNGVDEVVKGIVKDHPKWLKTAGEKSPDINSSNRGGAGPSAVALKEASEAQARQARGRF